MAAERNDNSYVDIGPDETLAGRAEGLPVQVELFNAVRDSQSTSECGRVCKTTERRLGFQVVAMFVFPVLVSC